MEPETAMSPEEDMDKAASDRLTPGGVPQQFTDPTHMIGFGQAFRHGPAVFQHGADAGRDTNIVLEYPERAGSVTDDVDARNMDADAAGGFKTVDRPVEMGAGGDELAWNHAIGHYGHPPVNVVEECFKCFDPLGNSAFEHIPLVSRDDTRDDVQGEGTLLPRVVESDATVQEGPCHGVGTGGDICEGKLAERTGDLTVGFSGNVAGGKHLVVGSTACSGLGVILE